MEMSKEQLKTLKKRRDDQLFCLTITHFFVFVIGTVGFLGSMIVVADIACEMVQEGKHVDTRLDKLVARDLKKTGSDFSSKLHGRDLELQRTSSLLFAMLYGISSVILLFAAIKRRSDLTLPWLFCESVMFMTQMAILLCPPFYFLPQIFAFQPEGLISNTIIMAVSMFMVADVAIMHIYWSSEQRHAAGKTRNSPGALRRDQFTGTIEEVRAHLEKRIVLKDMRRLLRNFPDLKVALVVPEQKGNNHGPQQIRTVT